MSVRDSIENSLSGLTKAQKKVANAILADYPFSGLLPIQELSNKLGVSAPSISRYVSKLGYGGYTEFQRSLIQELREGSSSPVEIHREVVKPNSTPSFSQYLNRIAQNIAGMENPIPQEALDDLIGIMNNENSHIYFKGGRVSDAIARYLSTHLQQIRGGVHHLSDDPEFWPEVILQLRKQDVFFIFDFRRYQPSLERLSKAVSGMSQARIVLVTDKWQSPVAKYASQIVSLPTEIDTAWDTSVFCVAFIEALIVNLSDSRWEKVQRRIKSWDACRDDLGFGINNSNKGD